MTWWNIARLYNVIFQGLFQLIEASVVLRCKQEDLDLLKVSSINICLLIYVTQQSLKTPSILGFNFVKFCSFLACKHCVKFLLSSTCVQIKTFAPFFLWFIFLLYRYKLFFLKTKTVQCDEFNFYNWIT